MQKKMIGAIKAGQAYLGWDDALYRQTLIRCNLDELRIIREYMHEQGFPRKAPAGKGRRPRVAMSRKSVLSKIEALLADAGRSWAYAEGLASHMYKQHVIEWLTDEQLFGVMVALTKDARKRVRAARKQ